MGLGARKPPIRLGFYPMPPKKGAWDLYRPIGPIYPIGPGTGDTFPGICSTPPGTGDTPPGTGDTLTLPKPPNPGNG